MGRSLGVADSSQMAQTIEVPYTSALVTQKVWIAPSACIVTAINGVTRVAGSGGACTLKFYKAPSGTAVASGTLLHSGTFDLVGTADTHQALTLSTTPTDLQLKAGDAIGYVLTGTATSAVGVICVVVEPV